MMEQAVESIEMKTEESSSHDFTSTMDQNAENDEPRTDDSSPKEFTRHCEYFHMVIRPMLTPGHEGELCEWMKEMGLLRRTWRCTNEDCKGVNGYMTWNKARVVDKYNWACPNCSKKLSIREGSFFIHIKCELKQIFQAILCWCEQTPVAQASATLGIKDHVVKRIYDRCSEVASKYVEDHNHAWLLGGDNAVVVIDIFPDGYMTSNPAVIDCAGKKNTKKVLCIADTSQMPARIWARILEQEHQGAVEEALMYVTQQIRPGSTLVANERAHACPYSAICQLKGYPSIISVETLMELDLPGTRRVQENLETIWQALVAVCEEVRDLPKKAGAILLNEFMWRQVFGSSSSTALESILHHIADQYLEDDN
ncbi:uncharacterized protein LOC126345148 [Schistocerca gregaria]|uniref:uncharacterized protein LOC126345148 n=1 Tax=Schistocerca gregaria TaxID=7010 RepID=UPI00211EFE16|nr:uncharacterized protein LOC126345148 [Schistocerca gregaria]XP_049858037.1 uncharacterized protein LOC126345148 [Schistocerca gregaria]XP_049858038.1 uncharacterized protein LOC126345148 [Schistocerca gregaria]